MDVSVDTKIRLPFIIALLLLCRLPLLAQVGTPVEETQKAKAVYLEVARLTRLPDAEQKRQITALYDAYKQVERRMYAYGGDSGNAAMMREEAAMSPEAFAAKLASADDWVGLREVAIRLGSDALRRHLDLVVPLIRADLRSNDPNRVGLGLDVVGQFTPRELFEDVINIYYQPYQIYISGMATLDLMRLNDPRTLRRVLPLLDRPRPPDNYFELLQQFLVGKRAPAKLIKMLDADAVEKRRNALIAVMRTGDDRLASYVPKLVRDAEPAIRSYACYAGMNLRPKLWQTVRPAVLTLLQDPDRELRIDIASALAARKDIGCADTLLALAQETTLQEWQQSNVVQAINNLTGSYFGYELGTASTTAANRAAVQRFAEWVRSHRSAPE